MPTITQKKKLKRGSREIGNILKSKYGDDFYKRIGTIGGRKSVRKGFATNRELAKQAGRIGGKKSKR